MTSYRTFLLWLDRNYGFGDFCDTMCRRIEKNIGIVGDNL